MDTVAVESVVGDAWLLVDDDATDAALRYADSDPLSSTTEADADRLAQLFENILRNARLHAGTGVTVGGLDDGFHVEDDGRGPRCRPRGGVHDRAPDRRGRHPIRAPHRGAGRRRPRLGIRVTDGSDGGARFEITGVNLPE